MDVKRTLERLQKTLPGPTIPAVGSALIGFSAVLLKFNLSGLWLIGMPVLCLLFGADTPCSLSNRRFKAAQILWNREYMGNSDPQRYSNRFIRITNKSLPTACKSDY